MQAARKRLRLLLPASGRGLGTADSWAGRIAGALQEYKTIVVPGYLGSSLGTLWERFVTLWEDLGDRWAHIVHMLGAIGLPWSPRGPVLHL